MKEVSGYLNALLQQNEAAFDSIKAAVTRSSEAVVEMIRIFQCLDKNRDHVRNALQLLECTLSNLRDSMELANNLKLSLTEALTDSFKFRTEAFAKVEKTLHQEFSLQQGVQNEEMVNRELLVVKKKIMELTQPELDSIESRTSILEQKVKLAHTLESLLSRLRTSTNIDMSTLVRTL